jgi:hypothetical protein
LARLAPSLPSALPVTRLLATGRLRLALPGIGRLLTPQLRRPGLLARLFAAGLVALSVPRRAALAAGLLTVRLLLARLLTTGLLAAGLLTARLLA